MRLKRAEEELQEATRLQVTTQCPINTPYRHTLSTHSIDTPCQYTLSSHIFYCHSHPPLTRPLLSPPPQHPSPPPTPSHSPSLYYTYSPTIITHPLNTRPPLSSLTLFPPPPPHSPIGGNGGNRKLVFPPSPPHTHPLYTILTALYHHLPIGGNGGNRETRIRGRGGHCQTPVDQNRGIYILFLGLLVARV